MADTLPPGLGGSGAPVAMPAEVRSNVPWVAVLAALALHLAFVIPIGTSGLQPDPRAREAAKPEPIAIEMITDAALKARAAPAPMPAPAPQPTPPLPPPPATVEATPLPGELVIGDTPPAGSALDMRLKLPPGNDASSTATLSDSLKAFQESLKEAPKAGAGAAPPKKGKIDTYTLAVRQSLARRMPAPPGGSGNVEMTLVLSETGVPVDVKLTRTSGIPAFDAAAMNAVWSCACPKAPPGSTVADRTIDVEFNF
jgi:TonB family protein